MLVVYFHAVLQIDKVFPDESNIFMLFGKSGVDIFFVISGFIMWHSTQDKPQSILRFYHKRIVRIVPLYWIITLSAAVVALIIPTLLKSTRLEPTHLIASLAFVPWPNPASSGGGDLMSPLIVPGWTLNFEMMFYAMFGIGLVGSVHKRLERFVTLFALLICVIILTRGQSQIISFYDPFLLVEFLLGIAISVAIDRGLLMEPRIAGGILLCAIPALVLLDAYPPSVTRLIGSGIPSAVAIYCMTSIDMARKWPDWRFLAQIGDASFSLYLTHIFVLAALRLTWSFLPVGDGSFVGQVAFMILALCLSCATGLLTYRLIERPLGRIINGFARWA